MKKTIKIKFLTALMIFFNIECLFSKNLIDEKYSNFVNEWYYNIANDPNYIYSGSLIIDDCKNNYCRYNILTTASGGYDCISDGKIEIVDDKNAIMYSYDYDTKELDGCRANISLSDNYEKLKINYDERYCWIGENACSLHGYILEDYEKMYGNDRKIYKTSFKCENLNLISDVYICTDKELAKLDLELSELYKAILTEYTKLNEKEKIQKFKKSQWEWLKIVQNNDPLKDIKKLYINRISELKKLINN